MLLSQFIRQVRGRGAFVARAVGAHPVTISQWASGAKPIPVQHCAAIEKATAGAVTRRELRPHDWHRIWPELIDAEHSAGRPCIDVAAPTSATEDKAAA